MSPLHTHGIPGRGLSGTDLPFSAGCRSPGRMPPRRHAGMAAYHPYGKKIEYLNALLKVGFDTLDFGSFVSAKAIPQMADTAEVLAGLRPGRDSVPNCWRSSPISGARRRRRTHDAIGIWVFPFPYRRPFSYAIPIRPSKVRLATVEEIQELCVKKDKELVVYLSMGFGNPYGDPWSEEIVFRMGGRAQPARREDHFAGRYGGTGYPGTGFFRDGLPDPAAAGSVRSACICIPLTVTGRPRSMRRCRRDAAV